VAHRGAGDLVPCGRPPGARASALVHRSASLRRLRTTFENVILAGGRNTEPDGALPPADVPVSLVPDSDGWVRIVPTGRGTRWLASALWAETLLAQQAGMWQRLKLCHNADCRARSSTPHATTAGSGTTSARAETPPNLRAFREPPAASGRHRRPVGAPLIRRTNAAPPATIRVWRVSWWREMLSAQLTAKMIRRTGAGRETSGRLRRLPAVAGLRSDGQPADTYGRGRAVPDLSAAILAAVPRRAGAGRRPVRRTRRCGAVQLILGLAQVGGSDIGDHVHGGLGATAGHLWHESAAWNVAVGAGYLFLALRRSRPTGLVPMLTAFVGMLLLLSVNDLTAARVDGTRLVSHGLRDTRICPGRGAVAGGWRHGNAARRVGGRRLGLAFPGARGRRRRGCGDDAGSAAAAAGARTARTVDRRSW
jgi:hypothetical protein